MTRISNLRPLDTNPALRFSGPVKHSQPEYDRHISAIPLPWQEEYRERVAIILADELEVSEVVLEDARRRAYEMTKASMDEHWRKSSHST